MRFLAASLIEPTVIRHPVGVHEIAKALGVRQSAVSNWQVRNVGFPRPKISLKGAKVWEWTDVREWAERTGRY